MSELHIFSSELMFFILSSKISMIKVGQLYTDKEMAVRPMSNPHMPDRNKKIPAKKVYILLCEFIILNLRRFLHRGTVRHVHLLHV